MTLKFRAVITTAFQRVVSEDLLMDFLLIVRTPGIVTTLLAWYPGIHGCSSIQLDLLTALLFLVCGHNKL